MEHNFIALGEYILKKTSHMSKTQQNKIIAFILHCISINFDGYEIERMYFEWLKANNGVIPDWRDAYREELV